MTELEEVSRIVSSMGADSAVLADRRVAHVVVSGLDLVSQRVIPGVEFSNEKTADGLVAQITVKRDAIIANPIHLCIGVLHDTGRQRIQLQVMLEDDSSAKIVAHCFFPRAQNVEHIMDAAIEIHSGAQLHHAEGHYHGPFGGVTVLPTAKVRVHPHGRYISDFSLTSGRVGKLRIDYAVDVEAHAIAELTAKVFGHAEDEIRISEAVVLSGEQARSLIRTRVALEGQAKAQVTGRTDGNAEGARGHVDCMEIVRDQAVAEAIPIVRVTHPLAKVTHEAAIGSIDQKQLETLMAHGLTPEQAVEMVVAGVLR
jgi:Fe-S cluster assembly scaffold protein SufB